jgi:hypothetical protein
MQEMARMEQARSDIKMPARVLSFNPKSLNELTIQDLRKLKQEREKIDQEEKDKQLASQIVWQGKSKKEREVQIGENKEVPLEAEIKAEEETNEEKKSKKSFWNIFKRKSKEENIEEEAEVLVGDSISDLEEK